jgi:Flp pilus assembly protein TadD
MHGVLLQQRGDLVGAEAASRRADARGSANGAYNLAVSLKQRGELHEANEALERARRRGFQQ